mgnify:CR=1 FL=1
MKYLVVSDIHGSSYYANNIKEIFNKEDADKIILLGDLYYHGPRNPLTKEYNPMEVSKTFNSLKNNILCIKGNCDAEVDEMISEFEFNESITLEINGLKFFFTHGHKYNIDNIPENIDVLVDSPFILELKSYDVPFRGSSNQRLINSKESVNQNKIIIYKY